MLVLPNSSGAGSSESSWRSCQSCWGCFFSHGSRDIFCAAGHTHSISCKNMPYSPLPTDELSSHHKQLIKWGIQLANAKSQTLLLVTANCACASPSCCNKGALGRKPMTFKHLQLWGDIGSSLSSSTPTGASILCSPRGPWCPPWSKGAWGRSRVAPSQSTATTSG